METTYSKIKHGGLGLISTEESSSIAFVANWPHSIHELPFRFPSLQESVDTIHSTDLELPSQLLAYHLNSAFLSLPLSPSLNDNLGNASNLCDLSLNPVKVQQRITQGIDKLKADLILDDAKGARDAARLRSLEGRAGAWLESVPTSEKFAMNKNEFQIAAFLRLGQSMPFNSCVTHSNCGRELDDDVTISSLVSLVEDLCGNTIIFWQSGVSVSGTCNCIIKKNLRINIHTVKTDQTS